MATRTVLFPAPGNVPEPGTVDGAKEMGSGIAPARRRSSAGEREPRNSRGGITKLRGESILAGLDVRVVGTASDPLVTHLRGDVAVACGCTPNNPVYKLRDMHVLDCHRCGGLIARCGYRVIAANWPEGDC